MSEEGKSCTRCSEFKHLDQFGVKATGVLGRKARCKPCLVADEREYASRNRDVVAARLRRWNAANPEYAPNYRRGYYVSKRDHLKNEVRRWQEANRDAFMARIAARKSRMRRFAPWADRQLIADIYKYARIVRECGVDCHVDHIVPLNGRRVSGLHVESNLTVLLAFDNISKGAKFNE